MMGVLIGAVLLLPAQQASSERLDSTLQYLRHLEAAEAALTNQKPDGAIREAGAALRVAPLDSAVKMLKTQTKGAAAYYALACAHAMKGDSDAALANLEKAADNGFTNRTLAKRDPRLEAITSHKRFAAALKRFPNKSLTDAYSGKTVKDGAFGRGIIQARKLNFPKLGEAAPDFELERMDGKGSLTLSSYRGKRPVVLIFGSYT